MPIDKIATGHVWTMPPQQRPDEQAGDKGPRYHWTRNHKINYNQNFFLQNGHVNEKEATRGRRGHANGIKNLGVIGNKKLIRENNLAMDASLIHMHLTGRLKKSVHPEIYYGKTGVDLPVLQIAPLDSKIFASQSGPDGGLTRVPSVNKQPLVKIANLDDELRLSMDANINVLSTSTRLAPTSSHREENEKRNGYETSNSPSFPNWGNSHEQAHGLSTSLYERHPVTGQRAGDPIADVFAICARSNNCILALADGVNWGEKSRLAARCAIRGAVDCLNDTLYNEKSHIFTTADIFRCQLRAFHAGHQLILQEGGSLTTLCIVVVCQLKGDPNWVVCSCNVGDSLAFVFNEKSGVREITLGSHDIQQMRDMRDAGGALGPVDGVNPELHNLTCSMTIVEEGDFIFLTSDGVSDNFDPVVGKFCVIKDASEPKRNDHGMNAEGKLDQKIDNDFSEPEKIPKKEIVNSKGGLTSLKSPEFRRRTRKAANKVDKEGEKISSGKKNHFPLVEAYQRHELTLLRMEYLLRSRTAAKPVPNTTARRLCETLIQFVAELTVAKRFLLEDPEIYRYDFFPLSQKDQKQRRRFLRHRISALPGKLDHATIVAYKIGEEKSNETVDGVEEAPVSPTENLVSTSSSIFLDEGNANFSDTLPRFLEKRFLKGQGYSTETESDISESTMTTESDDTLSEASHSTDFSTDRLSKFQQASKCEMPLSVPNLNLSQPDISDLDYSPDHISSQNHIPKSNTIHAFASTPNGDVSKNSPDKNGNREKAKHWRFGQLSKALNRIDKVIRNKKHGTRHPTVDQNHLSESQHVECGQFLSQSQSYQLLSGDKSIDQLLSDNQSGLLLSENQRNGRVLLQHECTDKLSETRLSANNQCEAPKNCQKDPSQVFGPSTSPSHRPNRWTPLKMFRAITRGNVGQKNYHALIRTSKTINERNSIEKSILEDPYVRVVPHSLSDTQIVQCTQIP